MKITRVRGRRVKVGEVVPGGLAEQAGLERGTEIVAIDGALVTELSWREIVVDRIGNPQWRRIKLLCLPPGATKPKTFRITRKL